MPSPIAGFPAECFTNGVGIGRVENQSFVPTHEVKHGLFFSLPTLAYYLLNTFEDLHGDWLASHVHCLHEIATANFCSNVHIGPL